MWKAVIIRRFKADDAHGFLRNFPAFARVLHAVNQQRFFNGFSNAYARVQRGKRILKNDLYLFAQEAKFLPRKIENIASLKKDLAGGRRHDAQNCLRQRAFAATTFAHKPQGLAAMDVEGDVVNGLNVALLSGEQAAVYREIGFETAHGQKRVATACLMKFAHAPASPLCSLCATR